MTDRPDLGTFDITPRYRPPRWAWLTVRLDLIDWPDGRPVPPPPRWARIVGWTLLVVWWIYGTALIALYAFLFAAWLYRTLT